MTAQTQGWDLPGTAVAAALAAHREAGADPRLLSALAGADELHRPTPTYSSDCSCDPEADTYEERHPEAEFTGDTLCLDTPDGLVCGVCTDDDGDYLAPAPWPCVTHRAIAASLTATVHRRAAEPGDPLACCGAAPRRSDRFTDDQHQVTCAATT